MISASTAGTAGSVAGQKIVILGTGGTIAGRAAQAGDNVGYVAGQVSVGDLIAAVPALAAVPMDVEQVAQIDSKDMDFAVWQTVLSRLACHLARPEVAGAVITHGTDTLEETAFFLQRVLQPAKPVVLTCAMRPATALVPDGLQNLLDAVTVARWPGARGVVVVCAGEVHSALDVAKVHTYQVNAFDSGDAGALGRVEEGRLRLFRDWPEAGGLGPFDAKAAAQVQQATALPRVALITSHADADGLLVRALLDASLTRPAEAVRGIVVAGTGNGTLHRSLVGALQEAESAGVRVVRSSRCLRGPLISKAGDAFVAFDGLSAVKARLALSLTLLGA